MKRINMAPNWFTVSSCFKEECHMCSPGSLTKHGLLTSGKYWDVGTYTCPTPKEQVVEAKTSGVQPPQQHLGPSSKLGNKYEHKRLKTVSQPSMLCVPSVSRNSCGTAQFYFASHLAAGMSLVLAAVFLCEGPGERVCENRPFVSRVTGTLQHPNEQCGT